MKILEQLKSDHENVVTLLDILDDQVDRVRKAEKADYDLMRDIHHARQYFEEVEVIYLHLFCLMAVPLRKMPGFRGILSFLEGIDRLLFRTLPFFGRYAWMTVLIFRKPK